MSELERKNGPSAVAETVTKDGRRIGTEILFSAKDITKTFGGTQALKGVELKRGLFLRSSSLRAVCFR